MITTIQNIRHTSNATGKKLQSILLLEDNMISLQEHTDILQSAGYELDYSIAGNNLTEIVKRKKFELILLNLNMDGINGYELIRKIKSSPANLSTPVVMISDEDQKKDMMQGLHISGIDFLKTPYTREELLTRINNQIMFFKSKEKLEQGKLLAQSIRYAERIQKAMSVPESTLTEIFEDHFLFSQPRDIVSGDFFWVNKTDSQVVLAVADCTGHGVPGAFLSVLGISLLNEICTKNKVDTAAMVLELLRKALTNSLLRDEAPHPIADGMDISVVIIDFEQMTLQFAGAYQKILIMSDSVLSELRGDLQPIGIHMAEKKFTNHIISLRSGTRIYLTTDGYVDQFGGDRQKKFQYSRYRELIRKTTHLNLEQQKAALIQAYQEWRGINEQVDDILVLGVEL